MDWGWVETYQTLIAGGLGFAGVIGTLADNARRGRKERKEQREHERAALRTALIQELKINLEWMRDSVNFLRRMREADVEKLFMPPFPVDDIYRSLIPRLGLLEADEVGKVVAVYMSMSRAYPTLRVEPYEVVD